MRRRPEEGVCLKPLLITALCLSIPAYAQDAGVPEPSAPAVAEAPSPAEAPPPAAELKRVTEYLENGKARGPAVMDLVPCLKVDQSKGGATSFQCLEPARAPVPRGTVVYGWMQWFVPRGGDYDDVRLQFVHEREVIRTIDLKVTGFGSVRMYRGFAVNRIGRWTLRVVRGDRELGSATVDVSVK